MSPQNKYDGFFSRKDIDMAAFKPDPLDVVKTLMQFAGEHPNFYKHENQRMIVAKGIHYVTDWMVGEKSSGRMPEIHLGFAAFMMIFVVIGSSTFISTKILVSLGITKVNMSAATIIIMPTTTAG